MPVTVRTMNPCVMFFHHQKTLMRAMLKRVMKMIKAWCKTDDHKASSITCQSARASNIFGKLHEGAKGAATALVGRRRLEALAVLEA